MLPLPSAHKNHPASNSNAEDFSMNARVDANNNVGNQKDEAAPQQYSQGINDRINLEQQHLQEIEGNNIILENVTSANDQEKHFYSVSNASQKYPCDNEKHLKVSHCEVLTFIYV